MRGVSVVFVVVWVMHLVQVTASPLFAVGNAPDMPTAVIACDSCADCTAKLAASAPHSEVVLTNDLLNILDRACIGFSGQNGMVFD